MATVRSPAIRVYRRVSTRFEPLRESLRRADFHAVVPPDAPSEWECTDDRGTRVRYEGGLVVVEAADDAAAEPFDLTHRVSMPSDHEVPDGGAPPERIMVIAGSDESGKGERARRLVVAAVAVPLTSEEEMLGRGVRDSKLCAEGEIASLAHWIGREYATVVRVVEAEDRGAELCAHGENETRLLASMHAECLRGLHGTCAFGLARVDRFAPGRPVARALGGTAGFGAGAFIVDECVRGERHVACAAASIVARALVLGAPVIGARHVPCTTRH